MVAEGHTQGVLSQNGSSHNGHSHNGSAKSADSVTVEAPSHFTEHYPANTLGCSEGAKPSSFVELKPKQSRQTHLSCLVCRGVESEGGPSCHSPPVQQLRLE